MLTLLAQRESDNIGNTLSELIDILLGDSADTRNRPLEDFCDTADVNPSGRMWELDRFRREHANLYERVRALFFCTQSIDSIFLQESLETAGSIPFRVMKAY